MAENQRTLQKNLLTVSYFTRNGSGEGETESRNTVNNKIQQGTELDDECTRRAGNWRNLRTPLQGGMKTPDGKQQHPHITDTYNHTHVDAWLTNCFVLLCEWCVGII